MFVGGSAFRFVIDAALRSEKEIKGAQKKNKVAESANPLWKTNIYRETQHNSEGFTRLVHKTAGNVAVPPFPRVV